MDEFWVRLSLVSGVLLVAYVLTLILRARATNGPLKIAQTGLQKGIYLFSSSTCADCATARKYLEDKLGNDGFGEKSWETEPGLFSRLGVEAVPATLIVDREGAAALWPGHPKKALDECPGS